MLTIASRFYPVVFGIPAWMSRNSSRASIPRRRRHPRRTTNRAHRPIVTRIAEQRSTKPNDFAASRETSHVATAASSPSLCLVRFAPLVLYKYTTTREAKHQIIKKNNNAVHPTPTSTPRYTPLTSHHQSKSLSSTKGTSASPPSFDETVVRALFVNTSTSSPLRSSSSFAPARSMAACRTERHAAAF